MAENRVSIDGAIAAGGALPVTGTFVPAFRTSLAAGATAAAPTAGTAVATLAAPPAGLYDIEVTIGMNGTLAAADTSNMNLKAGATTLIAKLAYAANGTSNPTAGPFRFRASLDGVSALTVNAVASATASSVYAATIIATQVN